MVPLKHFNFWSNCIIYFAILVSDIWNNDDFYNMMGFVCKKKHSSSNVLVTAASPLTSVSRNCRTGWYTFRQSCYLPVGVKEEDWCDSVTAKQKCLSVNGSLVIIDDQAEQVFLTFLLQDVRKHTWIALYKSKEPGSYKYFWEENKPLTFSNWPYGAGRFLTSKKDCVQMVYGDYETGHWKPAGCNEKLAFICESSTDPAITVPWTPASSQCGRRHGWLKQGLSCFKLFSESKPWVEASETCDQHGAKLISISDYSVRAVFKYLSLEKNTSTWIGLLKNSNQEYEWINRFPMTMCNWDENMPVTKGAPDLCFVSSSSGFWNVSDCQIPRPFICQINLGKPPLPVQGEFKNCTAEGFMSADEKDGYCYRIEYEDRHTDIYQNCYLRGGRVHTIHSKSQVEYLKKYLSGQNLRNWQLFIDLQRNANGGFAWGDGSPVNFEYWEDGEPKESDDNRCVGMEMENLKWKMVSCFLEQSIICSVKKEFIPLKISSVPPFNQSVNNQDNLMKESQHTLSGGAIAAILISLMIIIIALSGAYLYFKPQSFTCFHRQVICFRNVL